MLRTHDLCCWLMNGVSSIPPPYTAKLPAQLYQNPEDWEVPDYLYSIKAFIKSGDDRNTASSAAAKILKDTYGSDVVNEKICRRWFSASDFKKDDSRLKDEPRTGCSKNSVLSNCKLPLMKIQLALLEN
ncbi:hypothetical protein ACTXT7_010834 [Hymenolepis weldensis]